MNGNFLFIGTGASLGVPVIGCDCKVCSSTSSKDKRLRTSALLRLNQKKILIDCGPDFRQQALKHHITHIDGIIITHAHYDHTSSIDELKVYTSHGKGPLPCLLSQETAKDLTDRYKYIFEPEPAKEKMLTNFSLQTLPKERGTIKFQEIHFHYFTYEQAGMKVIGFRVGNFAYITDIYDYPDTIFEDLKGVEILVLSALRYTPSNIHLTVDQAIDFSKKVYAKETWLTHLSHDLSYEHTNAYLPQNVRMAYDGLEIPFIY